MVTGDTPYTFTLVVSDGQQTSAPDEVTVTVRNLTGERHFIPMWTGNGLDHMNINVIRATLDGADLDPGDEIGLFDGALCVGAARLNAIIDHTHILYMVASRDDGTGNGYTPGHPIRYKLWDSSAGEENDAPEALYDDTQPQWSTSGLYEPSATAVVALTGRSDITQTIPLIDGWNLFSVRTLPDAPDLMALLEPLILGGQLVKVQDEQGRTIEDLGTFGGWHNHIGAFRPGEGYKVKVTADEVLTIAEAYTKSGEVPPVVETPVHFIPRVRGNGTDHMNIHLVTCYPNPTTGKVTILAPATQQNAMTVEVLNAAGQVLFTRELDNNPSEIDLSGHGKGIYFVKILLNSTAITERIVLK